jgi:hypothetical protein
MMNLSYLFNFVGSVIDICGFLFGFMLQKNYKEPENICSICFSVVVIVSMVIHTV